MCHCYSMRQPKLLCCAMLYLLWHTAGPIPGLTIEPSGSVHTVRMTCLPFGALCKSNGSLHVTCIAKPRK